MMQKIFLNIQLLLLTGISFVGRAQYSGGTAEGSAYNTFSASVCAVAANANIYFGGVQDGFSSRTFTASVCPAAQNANIYFGGIQDGFSTGALTTSVCPPGENANIYFGGIQDGFSTGVLTVSVCPPGENANIYFGGIQDGFSTGALTVSVCPPGENANIYFGGIQDGFSTDALTVSVCPAQPNANIYFGGIADGFSQVLLKGATSPCLLSIALVSFTGSCINQSKVLQWGTAGEDNNDYFTIEYSPDGASWQTVGTVPGAGNSSAFIHYSFTDASSHTGTSYYRLIQTDQDGKSTYSSVISIGSCIADGTGKFNVYPDPSTGPLSLSFEGDISDIQSIEIYDAVGERVYFSRMFQSTIDLSDKAAGTYFIHVNSGAGTIIKEVLIWR